MFVMTWFHWVLSDQSFDTTARAPWLLTSANTVAARDAAAAVPTNDIPTSRPTRRRSRIYFMATPSTCCNPLRAQEGSSAGPCRRWLWLRCTHLSISQDLGSRGAQG